MIDYARYRAARAANPDWPVRVIGRKLRQPPEPHHANRLVSFGQPVCEWDDGPFHVTVTVVPDEDTQPEPNEGRITATWEPEAIPMLPLDGQPRYYVPTVPWRESAAYWRKLGYARHAAYTAARTMVLRAMVRRQTYGDTWWYEGILAVVTVDGLVVGQDSIWGIESDAPDDYVDMWVNDVAAVALDQARATVTKLARVAAQLQKGATHDA